jgi:hypothetical protein
MALSVLSNMRQDFLQNFIVEVQLPLTNFPCSLDRRQVTKNLEIRQYGKRS